jgi:heme/copper-type cytochrome/quinol oxidase subunit 2
MRLVILAMCSIVAAGVFVAMFLSIWSTRRAAERAPAFGQGLASELVWAAIPCLMILAAAIPAVMALMSARAGG